MSTCAIPTVKPPRRRRWLWLVGFVVLLIGLPVGYSRYQGYAASRDLAALMAELDATDPGWRLEDVEAGRRVVPDEQNAALLVEKIVPALGGFNAAIGAIEGKFNGYPSEVRLSPEVRLPLRETFAPLAALRAEALRLKDLPEGRYPIQYTDDFIDMALPHLMRNRAAARFLRFDALLRAEEEDLAGAVQACRALLNIGRAIGDEPFVISMLERSSRQELAADTLKRVLAQGKAPEAELRLLQELLEREIREPLLCHAARGERGGGDRVFRALADGRLNWARITQVHRSWGLKTPWIADGINYLPLSVSRSHEAHLRFMTRMVEAGKLPIEKQVGALTELSHDFQAQPLMVRQLLGLPIGLISQPWYVNVQAKLRSALVAVAAERYRQRHGRWPADAADLVRDGLLGEVPADPGDGQPLRWRLLEGGAEAYSVYTAPGGTGIGFRLWDVAARRQAPPRPINP
jgi:hypothetical protein